MKQYIDAFNVISLCLTIALFIGWIQSPPVLFVYISYFIKIMVGFVLVYKFNDFTKPTPFTSIDKKICFLAGTYILFFTIGDYVKHLWT
jgi:hypothetical protein